MTTMFTIGYSHSTGVPQFAIVADDTTATYVLPADGAQEGFDAARVERLASRAKNKPTNAEGWLRLASKNTGYVTFSEPQELDGELAAVVEKVQAEVDLEVVQLSAEPVDPTQTHEFVPLALGDEICGYCDQSPDAEVHQT